MSGFYGIYLVMSEVDEAYQDAVLLDDYIRMQFGRVRGVMQYMSRLTKHDGQVIRTNYHGEVGKKAMAMIVPEGGHHREDFLGQAAGCTLFIWRNSFRLKSGDYLGMTRRIIDYLE